MTVLWCNVASAFRFAPDGPKWLSMRGQSLVSEDDGEGEMYRFVVLPVADGRLIRQRPTRSEAYVYVAAIRYSVLALLSSLLSTPHQSRWPWAGT
jgi:hypothetical protein